MRPHDDSVFIIEHCLVRDRFILVQESLRKDVVLNDLKDGCGHSVVTSWFQMHEIVPDQSSLAATVHAMVRNVFIEIDKIYAISLRMIGRIVTNEMV